MGNVETKLEDGALSFSKDSVIVTNDAVYDISLLGDITDESEFNDETAYIDNNIFYIFRGIPKKSGAEYMKPGIYQNREGSPKYYIVEPKTDEDIKTYSVSDHVASLVPTSIIDTANTKEELLIAIPESTKVFQPVLLDTDDILKRVLKTVLLEKNVDLDRYKDRFRNKNELFNLKQVIRGKNKVSILIFDRGCDALNVKYTIIVEEKSDDDVVGTKLKDPIIISSEDTYQL